MLQRLLLGSSRLAPSRTFAIARFTVISHLLLGALATIVLLRMPTAAQPLCDLFQTLAMSMAAAGGIGAGGLAARDSMSRGLTSSQGETVLAAQTGETPEGVTPFPS